MFNQTSHWFIYLDLSWGSYKDANTGNLFQKNNQVNERDVLDGYECGYKSC